MSKFFDHASEVEAQYLADAIASARVPKGPRPHPEGLCLWCEADAGGEDRRFCSADCAREWERDQEARRRNGHR